MPARMRRELKCRIIRPTDMGIVRMRKERSQAELYADPERADALLWSRRKFIKGSGAVTAAMSSRLGSLIRFARFMPAGYLPVALAAQPLDSQDGLLRILNDRPLNAETPAHLLNDQITPADRLFVRNNGLLPEQMDAASWRLSISGESA